MDKNFPDFMKPVNSQVLETHRSKQFDEPKAQATRKKSHQIASFSNYSKAVKKRKL